MKESIFAKCIQMIMAVSFVFVWQASAATVTYTADNSLFPNPEAGNFYHYGNTGVSYFIQPVSTIAGTLTQQRQNNGCSVICLPYYIGDWKYQDLPQSTLDRIDADLASCRSLGYKAIPHFQYAYDYDYESQQDWREPEKDATKDIIVRHCNQLKSVWAKNSDVLAFIAWGMIGPWGELWISSNNNVGGTINGTFDWGNPNENTRAIYRAELDCTPADRMVCYAPQPVRILYGDAPIYASEAFMGSDKARIGFENQCFLTDQSASNPTYANNPGRGPTSYMAVSGAYVPQIAWPDVGCGYYPTADQLIAELDAGHWDHIVGGTVGSCLGKDLSDPEVERVLRKTGYRFRLTTATAPESVELGNTFAINVTIVNENGGTLYNPRKIEIILRNQAGGSKYVLNVVGDDAVRYNRLYLPGSHETKTLTITGGIPTGMPTGNYDVLLNLPDPYPSIHDRPEYSIRCANTNMWEASTGYNNLNLALKISAIAGGTAYTGSNWFSLNGATTATEPTITGPTSLSSGSTGSAYTATYTASGSTPISWSVSAGTLPSGMSLNASTGVYKGTPTTAGTFTFTVKATNSLGNNTKNCSHTIRTVAPNLALNKQATASSLEVAGYEAINVTDGNLSSRWGSAWGVDPQWLSVDLGNTYSVDSIVLNWEASYAKTYKIQISGDGNSWADAYTTTTGDGAIDNISITPTTGRFVRIYGTQRATQYGYSLWEIEVYGTALTTKNRISVIGDGRLKFVRSATNRTYDIRGRTVVDAKTAGRGVYVESLPVGLTKRVAERVKMVTLR